MGYDSFEYGTPISVKPDRNIRTRKPFSFCGCLLGITIGGVVAGGAIAVVMWYTLGNYSCQSSGTFLTFSFSFTFFVVRLFLSIHDVTCLWLFETGDVSFVVKHGLSIAKKYFFYKQMSPAIFTNDQFLVWKLQDNIACLP